MFSGHKRLPRRKHRPSNIGLKNMRINQKKISTLISATASIIATFLAVYLILLVLTLGSTHTYGLYVSLEFIKVGIIGFLVAIALSSKVKQAILMSLAIAVNVVSELIQELFLKSAPLEKTGETIVVYHQRVESSIFDIGEIILVIIVSVVLLSFFYWIREKVEKIKKTMFYS
jgi:hypothetical protein